MKRYALFDCEDDDAWGKDTYEKLFQGLRRDGDLWEYVHIARTGEVPRLTTPPQFDGVVISGSHYNVRDNPPWMNALCDFIRDGQKLGVKIFGGCYGCQIVAHALGGQVGRNPSNLFVFGLEKIQVGEKSPKVWNIHECHGDCVLELPPGASRLATSQSCTNEVFSIGDNVLCMQSHPEFTTSFMRTFLFDDVKHLLTEEQLAHGCDALTPQNQDSNDEVLEFIRNFLSS
eukprot:PhF_6_TR18726/c0_g1_i1/m.27356